MAIDKGKVARLTKVYAPPLKIRFVLIRRYSRTTTASTSNSIGSMASLGTGISVCAGNASPNMSLTFLVSTAVNDCSLSRRFRRASPKELIPDVVPRRDNPDQQCSGQIEPWNKRQDDCAERDKRHECKYCKKPASVHRSILSELARHCVISVLHRVDSAACRRCSGTYR